MIDYINDNIDHHIITVEDPIEFYHTTRKSTVNQRELGVDVPTFAEAIRRALRQDPDVILVGEMRDLETIETAITAAETGHIVFGTLHTTGAQGTVNRIIDVFPTNQQEQIRTQLSTSIIGILSQALLPKIGGGRIAAYEMLVVNSAVANLIRENKTFRITSVDSDRSRSRACNCWTTTCSGSGRKKKVRRGRDVSANATSEDVRKRIAHVERGMFEDEADAERELKKWGTATRRWHRKRN